jgi:hypothetical protein
MSQMIRSLSAERDSIFQCEQLQLYMEPWSIVSKAAALVSSTSRASTG